MASARTQLEYSLVQLEENNIEFKSQLNLFSEKSTFFILKIFNLDEELQNSYFASVDSLNDGHVEVFHQMTDPVFIFHLQSSLF